MCMHLQQQYFQIIRLMLVVVTLVKLWRQPLDGSNTRRLEKNDFHKHWPGDLEACVLAAVAFALLFLAKTVHFHMEPTHCTAVHAVC